MHVLACQVSKALKVTHVHVCVGIQQLLTCLPVTLHEAASRAGDTWLRDTTSNCCCLTATHFAKVWFFVLQLFSSTAAALPAEVGPDGKLLQPASTPPFAIASKSVLAWRRRLAAQRGRRQQRKQSEQQ